MITYLKYPAKIEVDTNGVSVRDSPFGDSQTLEIVRMVATARVLMPFSRVRLSAGREQLGEEAQILCFLAGANSIFYGDSLLTTSNPAVLADRQLLSKAGVKVNWDGFES